MAFEVNASKRRKELQESAKLAWQLSGEEVVLKVLRSFGFEVEMVGRR